MIFIETKLQGAFIIDLQRHGDARGFFARAFCANEMKDHGIAMEIRQSNLSHNKIAGTLRGMHFQHAPKQEAKLVRCVAGALYDVIVDNRPDSPTYLQHIGVELTAENGRALYVPKGFAHGFMTLQPDTMANYLVDEFYTPELESGLRYNDPALGIEWPGAVTEVSEKDANWPLINTEA